MEVTKKGAKEIINTLTTNRFYAECPRCEQPILLRDAGLFYLDDFSPKALELYNQNLLGIKEQEKILRNRRRTISESSESGAKAVNIGLILERIAPCIGGFPFDHNDCRSLFDPIDYIIFEGLSTKSSVSKIVFVEIKTGGARLTSIQRQIRELIKNKLVDWETYETEGQD
jgi:predicted Holliday junction resolvase-like endonuclease